jgi:UDP-N-acetylmuramoyl-L-alanyl-D-glutamate--2,6-diaminopimelate ligase
MPLLSEMLSDLPIAANVEGACRLEISGITTDSRQVKKGMLYIAIRGTKLDGHQFIAEALKNGAAAVVVDQDVEVSIPLNTAMISVDDTREALAHLAGAYFGPQPNIIVAVTGTDGKTSTAEFTRQLFELSDYRAASIGTLGLRCGDAAVEARFPPLHTSPDPIALHGMLQALKTAKIEHVALEASSHGLDQYRLDAVRLDAAALTTITRDHLDYHGTLEAYLAAKARLFETLLPEGKTAVLNMDDAYAPALRETCERRRHRIVTYGKTGEDLCIAAITPHAGGMEVALNVQGAEMALSLPHYGAFQVYNMMAACGLASASGEALPELVAQCARLVGIPGRLELVARHPTGAPLFIDYAHTPGALEKLLQVMRHHITGKLHVVFGAGGDRDTGKRPLMGAVAEKLADRVIVTDDNPRSEDPAAIRAAILKTCPKAMEIGDRAEAIFVAMQQLQEQDALIVAGKGHETTQTIGSQVLPFNDATAIREALERI